MGLAISVRTLASALEQGDDAENAEHIRESIDTLNKGLVAAGLPPHLEPTALPPFPNRGSWAGYPYGYIHHLRRAVAYSRHAPKKFAKIDRDQDPATDLYYDKELSDCRCHLICHSDTDGFYVPIDFPEVLYAAEELGIEGGGIIGSSQRLLAELIHVAPLLEIELEKDNMLSDAEAKRLMDESHRYFLERAVWFSVFDVAEYSVAYGSLIVFS